MRNPKQYQALSVIGVVPEIPKREVAIAFRGDPKEEKYDLVVVIPAGVAATMVLGVHGACNKIDAQSRDTAAVMQPIQVTGAEVAHPVMGHCAVLFRAGGFQLPAMMKKEAALQIIDALKEAVALLDMPPFLPKQLS